MGGREGFKVYTFYTRQVSKTDFEGLQMVNKRSVRNTINPCFSYLESQLRRGSPVVEGLQKQLGSRIKGTIWKLRLAFVFQTDQVSLLFSREKKKRLIGANGNNKVRTDF